MFQDFRPYAQYDDSRSWEGLVPSHWRRTSMRALAREVAVTGAPDEPMLSVSIKHGVTPQAVVLAQSGKRDSSNVDRSSYKLVEPGDVVYNKMRAWQGAAGLSAYRGIVSPAYIVLRPDLANCHPVYLHYLLRLPGYAAEAARWSYGISSDQWSLRPEHFRLIPVAVPPIEEQRAIVTYLAHAHQRINKAIATKRQLVALTRESKRAIAQSYVRGGMDTSASVRDSGIPWVGTVPAHWEIRRIANVFDNLNYRRIPLSTEVRGRMSERRFDYYGASGVIDQVEDYIFDEPTILVAEDGANLVLRNLPLAIKAEGKYWVNNHAHILRPRFGEIDYYAALLESIDYRPWISGAAQPKLTKDRLKSVSIAVPPVDEQAAIVRQIARETAVLDRMIARTSDEIGLLNEFKARLTSDVVTGQIDVRSISATLPVLDLEGILASEVSDTDPAEDGADDDGMEDE